MISNLCSIGVMLMKYLLSFLLLIMQINLSIIWHFSLEKDKNGSLPFLDLNIFCENKKFATNIYRKTTFSGVYINFKSLIPERYKIGLSHSYIHHQFVFWFHQISTWDWSIEKYFVQRQLPMWLGWKMIGSFLDKILAPKTLLRTVPKKEFVITLPYLGKLSLQICTGINQIMKNKLSYCNIQCDFQTKWKIIAFFIFEDRIPLF